MLLAASFDSFDGQDKQGWTLLHRAAAYGNGQDVKSLVKYSYSSLRTQTTGLSWTPIFFAVQFGNLLTFNELKQHYQDLLIVTDVRKWTLLHIAVNAKQFEMIRLLISLGADPHARSIATQYRVSEDLKDISVTPGDIARLRGKEVLASYTNFLRRAGHDVEIVANEKGEGGDMFWHASG